GTLATTQVTLVSTTQLVLGKFLAAWITTLAFAAATVPFMLYAGLRGSLSPATVASSLGVIAAEMAVVAAFAVGLSAVMRKGILSIVATYLLVALLSTGTLIGFGLIGASIREVHT